MFLLQISASLRGTVLHRRKGSDNFFFKGERGEVSGGTKGDQSSLKEYVGRL